MFEMWVNGFFDKTAMKHGKTEPGLGDIARISEGGAEIV